MTEATLCQIIVYGFCALGIGWPITAWALTEWSWRRSVRRSASIAGMINVVNNWS